VRVETSHAPDAIVIPSVALFQDPGAEQYHVFVIGKDGRLHRTPVKLGLRDKDLAQVISGVAPGDQIVTSGGYALSDGLQVRVAEAQK
jgi:multidrug efflux pump subunit AcrA (membrane-fusion protein)